MSTRDSEFEGELEEEFEFEEELESELEFEGEFEGEFEEEFEFEEELESELEFEGEFEEEFEFEEELEGEEFFPSLRRLRRAVRNAAPILRRIGRVAAPVVGTAVAGPVGGMIARTAAGALLEGQAEEEFEFEGEFETEAEARPSGPQAIAEMMAAAASRTQSEAEAEAYIGAATVYALSPGDRRALQAVLPHVVRGVAVLTRILRQRRTTRPTSGPIAAAVARRTGRVLARRAAAGRPVTPRVAGAVMARQTQRVLGDPRTTARALTRNARATRQVARPVGPGRRSATPSYAYRATPSYRPFPGPRRVTGGPGRPAVRRPM